MLPFRSTLTFLAPLLLPLALAACGDSATTDAARPGDDALSIPGDESGIVREDGVARMRSALSRRAPELAEGELSELVTDNATFALGLYHELARARPGSNFFYAPHSISTAMSMAYVGARASTRDALATALHFTLPEDVLRRGQNQLSRELQARQRPASAEVPGLVLRTSNDIWVSEDAAERPLPSYVDAITLDYDAKVAVVDFHDEPAARAAVNGEVSRQTEGTITDLLAPGDIKPGVTTMVLTNAVYFKAGWAQPFDAAGTRSAPFHNLDGSKSNVSLMATVATYEYAETSAGRVLRLPYVGGETALLLLLPAGDFSSFESGLDLPSLEEARGALAPRSVHVQLPAFELRTSTSLKQSLQNLGMYAGFEGQAEYDFSGIGPTQKFITDVVHQAFVAVDEVGTEAGAATAVLFGDESAGPAADAEFIADRPFIAFIEDVPTRTLLFAGRYVSAK